MKKILVILLLAFGLTASAQDVGIKAGANFSNLYQTEFSSNNVKISPSFGIYAKLPLVRDLFIQPELLYSNRGSQVRYNGLLGSNEYRFNLNYIDLPVSLVAQVTPVFSVSGGGYVGYLADANIRNHGSYDYQNVNEDDFNRWDMGIQAGVGFDFGGVGLNGRYNLGLVDIGKSGTPSEGSKNNFVTIGFNIPF